MLRRVPLIKHAEIAYCGTAIMHTREALAEIAPFLQPSLWAATVCECMSVECQANAINC
jgi:hypothetical protein